MFVANAFFSGTNACGSSLAKVIMSISCLHSTPFHTHMFLDKGFLKAFLVRRFDTSRFFGLDKLRF